MRRHDIRRSCTLALFASLSATSLACDGGDGAATTEGDCNGAKCDDADGDEERAAVCVAVRGNGPLITSHFGVLAQIMEEHGPVAGVAGGSSGSITSFLTESIMNNPLLDDCRPRVSLLNVDGRFPPDQVAAQLEPELACSPDERRARAALLYKSLIGYFGTLTASEEALAIEALWALRAANEGVEAEGADDAIEGADAQGEAVDEEGQAHPAIEAVRSALTLLQSRDLRELINGEVLDLIISFKGIAFAKDIIGALKAAAAFEPGDHHMFIRPGVIDFEAFGRKLGRLASFYAGPKLRVEISEMSQPVFAIADLEGYGPYWALEAGDLERASDGGGDPGLSGLPGAILTFDDAYRWFLDGCAEQSVGMTWDELKDLPVDACAGKDGCEDERVAVRPISCGELFSELVGTYRQEFRQNESDYYSRADDQIGFFGSKPSEITTLATTGVIGSSQGKATWEAARDTYFDEVSVPAEAWDIQLTDDPSTTDVFLGYWGASNVLSAVETGIGRWSDIKSKLYRSLGSATWEEILSASPAEPGMAAGVPLSSGDISVGGWSDPHPVMVLKSTGACDEVYYITKRGEEGTFARGVQAQLGGEAVEPAFYDLDDPSSSFNVSLLEADRTYCTSWDGISPAKPDEVFADGYRAADVVTGPGDGTSIRGCTPRE